LLAAGAVQTLAASDDGMPTWWLSVCAVAVPASVLVVLALRARTARPALMAAFRRGLGDDFVRAALPHRSRIPLTPCCSLR
jgi:hypothetical protein